MSKEVTVNKMGTMAVPKVMLSMGIPMILSIVDCSIWNWYRSRGNVMLAKSLGQRDREKVAKVAGNGVSLALIIYLAFLVFGLFGVKTYIGSQTKDVIVFAMGNSYLFICTTASFSIILFSIYEKLL